MRSVLIPVKSFRQAKLRLGTRLSADGRRRLGRFLADSVTSAAGETPTFVACDDDEVANWAVDSGASVLWTPGFGLSGAVTAGVERLAGRGFDLAVVAHSDLLFARNLGSVGAPGSVTLAPDRHRDGTNVAVVPTNAQFQFAYGPGSFDRHQREAARIGVSCQIVDDWRLATDLDRVADLEHIDGLSDRPELDGHDRALISALRVLVAGDLACRDRTPG